MELAAVASFAILVIAWIVAPERARTELLLETPMPGTPPEPRAIAA